MVTAFASVEGFVTDARLLLAMRNVVEFSEEVQVLVASNRAVFRDRLRRVTDGAANLNRLARYRESAGADLTRVGGKSVVTILMAVLLPAPLEPRKPNTSPALASMVEESTAVNAPKLRAKLSISTIVAITAAP